MNYVGIDIHKRYSVCVAQDERGRRLGEARIEGNLAAGFAQFFCSLGGKSRVVIEACWNWQAIYDRLERVEPPLLTTSPPHRLTLAFREVLTIDTT
ncbi:MAG: hypothetical protein DME96_01480 [Verrucomicrobia bacterium]|nr:MAG: hypothetical protein DME96_01480 [Verrucomicrobiota bacterium]